MKPEDELVLRKMAEEDFDAYARKLCKDAGFSKSDFRGSTIYCYDYRGDYHEVDAFVIFVDQAEVNEYDGEYEFEALGEATFSVDPASYIDKEKVKDVEMKCHVNRTITDPNKVVLYCSADVVPGPESSAEEICEKFDRVAKEGEYPDTKISCKVDQERGIARVTISQIEEAKYANLEDFEEYAMFIIGDQFFDEKRAMADILREANETLERFKMHADVDVSLTVEPTYCEDVHETNVHVYDCTGTAWITYRSKDPVKLYDEVVTDFKVPES